MISRRLINNIKKSIVSEECLINKNFQINELSEKVCKNINCYAYSLGIMRPAPSKSNLYVPGFTTETILDYSSGDNLMLKVSEDLNNLNIKYRRINLEDNIVLKKNEYLIQVLYIQKNEELFYRGNFHFSRQGKNGQWFSKMGWFYQPSFEKIKVSRKEEKSEFVIVTSEYCSIEYQRIGYFAITEI